ncbi:NAD(P)-dependent oxidoreductase [Micromonospora sp. R77]|uniref:NAD-dependent epimerase/dehydratase family protein n=1 Tax=Micromonospora sp. R77 TaxID=2925836 RepID=UPI001F61428A|nr:NAD(P)-dependent oxidoreductase [Micromonospora sp. R77]MCI4065646.1 NAD(P)-dependent oxidoreductase [Micromonospora sp. R77]
MRAAGPVELGPPTAVVLGAAGFIGRTVCATLHAAGWRVTGLARRSAVPAPWPTRHLDLVAASGGELFATLAELRPTLVVNAAGALWAVTDDELTVGNVTLVGRIVAAVAALPRPARLVHLGSAYEYGDQPGGRTLSEHLEGHPTSRYGQTKLAGTRLVTRAVAQGRVDAVVLRLSLALGPFAPRSGLFGGIAHQLAGQPAELRLPPVAGTRDIVDVRDVADAVCHAAAAPTVPPVVNVGGGVGVRLTDAVDELIRIAGSTATIVRVPPPAVRRHSGTGDLPLDIGLARRALGWSPRRTLTEALQAVWDTVSPPVGVAAGTSGPGDGTGTSTSNLVLDGDTHG